MTPELKAKWLADLATAKHGIGSLVTNANDEGEFRFCCLGRLACVLGGKVERADEMPSPYDPVPAIVPFIGGYNIWRDGEYMFDRDSYGMLRGNVLKEAGLGEHQQGMLTDINDKSTSFAPVIAWIEENL